MNTTVAGTSRLPAGGLRLQPATFSARLISSQLTASVDQVKLNHRPGPLFGSRLDNNRGVKLPMAGWDLGFEHSAQLQQALLMLSAEKKALGDNSSINLALDSLPFDSGSWGVLAG